MRNLPVGGVEQFRVCFLKRYICPKVNFFTRYFMSLILVHNSLLKVNKIE